MPNCIHLYENSYSNIMGHLSSDVSNLPTFNMVDTLSMPGRKLNKGHSYFLFLQF